MQLTDHFADTELGVAGSSQQIVANASQLCRVLLEPIRAKFGPLTVNDGYRDPVHNARVGGKPDSQHLYLGGNSAADFRPTQVGLQQVFDWIRMESDLPFDQIILEVDAASFLPRCIHISYNAGLQKQRRQALTGQTHGTGVYTPAEVH